MQQKRNVSTREVISAMEGELFAFPYTKQLTVVGTYHGLNANDETKLYDLIKTRDFTAIEYCNDVDDTYHDAISQAEGFDKDYLSLFVKTMQNSNSRNLVSIEQRLGVKRVDENEMWYMMAMAKELNKPQYWVDIPSGEMLRTLANLPFEVKEAHMNSMNQGGEFPPTVMYMMGEARENHMLVKIEEKEGPLDQMTRTGILGIGMSHATNFFNRMRLNKNAGSYLQLGQTSERNLT